MIVSQQKNRSNLHILLAISFILITIGLIFIYSASSVYAMEKFGVAYYFVIKQLVGVVLGTIAFFIASTVPLRFIKKLIPLFFLSTLVLTALTLVNGFAQRVHGSSRWLNLGGFVFQPSELLKISLILYVAYFLHKKEGKPQSFFHSFLPLFVIIGLTCAVLLKQPDFGLTVTLLITVMAMLFVGQFHTRYLLFAVGSLIPAAIALVVFKPYRLRRILTFMDPWSDPQGAGFQIIQSFIAIGSGHFWGIGISNSKQKFFYLPMQHTDFIFSIIAEETGFFGSIILIFLYILFMYFGFKIAWHMQDSFSRLATFGFVTLLSLQTIINLAVVTGLVPTKGIGLPFVSYGNTFLICSMIMLGLIMNMVHSQK